MKKSTSKLLNLLLAASFVGTAAVGGALLVSPKKASAAESYKPTSVFTMLSAASVGAAEDDKKEMVFTLPNGGEVQYRRDLALKWHESATPSYFYVTFELNDFNFQTLTFTFETASAVTTKDQKSVNKVVFTTDGDNVTIKVGEKTDDENAAFKTYAKTDLAGLITLSLTETYFDGNNAAVNATEGEYFVRLQAGSNAEDTIGSFTNVGSTFGEYLSASSDTPITPFGIKAKMPDGKADEKTVISFREMNGQPFALDETSGEVKDTAKPVLVVNDEISSIALGTPFMIDYELIDVLDSSVKKTVEYYQYSPNATDVEYKPLTIATTTSSTSATSFFDKEYDSDGDGKNDTTVFKKAQCEYISIRFKLEDDVHKDTEASVFYLSYYMTQNAKPTLGGATADLDSGYVRADKNNAAPFYFNTLTDAELDAYEDSIKTEGVNAGSSAKVYLPSLRTMISDNDTGYKSLKFNIYYRTDKSDTTSSKTSLDFDDLEIPVTTDGQYEFKVVALDKAGNVMKTTIDGKEVDVTSSNVWDADNIPSFTFSVTNEGLSLEDEDEYDRKSDGTIDVKYTMSEFDVNSVSDNYGKDYYLYYFDIELFKTRFNKVSLVADDLSTINYDTLNKDFAVSAVEDGDYEGYFLEKYAAALAAKFDGVSADDFLTAGEDGKAIIRAIGEKQSGLSEDVYPDNKYEWNPEARSFLPDAEGLFLMFGVFKDAELPGEAIAAYKVIEVEATVDRLTGETQWLKNNIVSVILFSIAGVMLILMIILLTIKPSDEELEEVTETKKEKKSKKAE